MKRSRTVLDSREDSRTFLLAVRVVRPNHPGWRRTPLGCRHGGQPDARSSSSGRRSTATVYAVVGALGLLCFVALASLLADDRDGIACGCGDLTYRRCEEGRALRIETGVVPAQKSRPYHR